MLDIVFSGSNVFILYLVLAASFLQPLFPCHSTRLIGNSMIIRHILGFLTLIFFVVVSDTELDDYMPLGTILAVAATLYAWFIVSSRMSAYWWVGLVFLLAALYLVDLYESRERNMSAEKQQTIEYVKTGLIATSLGTTLLGFLIYVGEKKLEFRGDFNYLTFFLGKEKCADTPSTVPYMKALEAAFKNPTELTS
jgi:hypothetical protein